MARRAVTRDFKAGYLGLLKLSRVNTFTRKPVSMFSVALKSSASCLMSASTLYLIVSDASFPISSSSVVYECIKEASHWKDVAVCWWAPKHRIHDPQQPQRFVGQWHSQQLLPCQNIPISEFGVQVVHPVMTSFVYPCFVYANESEISKCHVLVRFLQSSVGDVKFHKLAWTLWYILWLEQQSQEIPYKLNHPAVKRMILYTNQCFCHPWLTLGNLEALLRVHFMV